MKNSLYALGFQVLAFIMPGTVTANSSIMEISATVEPSCTITAGDLRFEIRDLAKPSYGTAIISVLCTKGTNFVIGLGDIGKTDDVIVLNHKMRNKNSYLVYYLYRDANRNMLWGDNKGSMVSGVGTGQRQYFTVYGKVAGGQKADFGQFSDNINVTISLGGNAQQLSYQLSVTMDVIARNFQH